MVLFDTHILLWILSDPDQLAENALEILDHEPWAISIASFWEISIKTALKNEKRRLVLGMSLDELEEQLKENEIEILPKIVKELRYCRIITMIHLIGSLSRRQWKGKCHL